MSNETVVDPFASLPSRIVEKLHKLETLTSAANQAKGKMDALKPYVRDARDLSVTLARMMTTEAEADCLAEVFGSTETRDALWSALVTPLSAFLGPLGTATGEDRTEGDAIARQMRANLDSAFMEDESEDLKAEIEKVLAAWNASTPVVVKSSGSGGARGPRIATDPSKRVYAQCQCGKVLSDGTSANSLRMAVLHGHWASKHNAGVKIDNTDQRWLDFTTGAERCFKDGGTIEGGASGFTFRKGEGFGQVTEPGSTQVAA